MRFIKHYILILYISCSLLTPLWGWTKSTAQPAQIDLYESLDRLADIGLLNSYKIGNRAYTPAQISGFLSEARNNFESGIRPQNQDLLNFIKQFLYTSQGLKAPDFNSKEKKKITKTKSLRKYQESISTENKISKPALPKDLYENLDLLQDIGLLNSHLRGQRSYTPQQIEAKLNEARHNFELGIQPENDELKSHIQTFLYQENGSTVTKSHGKKSGTVSKGQEKIREENRHQDESDVKGQNHENKTSDNHRLNHKSSELDQNTIYQDIQLLADLGLIQKPEEKVLSVSKTTRLLNEARTNFENGIQPMDPKIKKHVIQLLYASPVDYYNRFEDTQPELDKPAPYKFTKWAYASHSTDITNSIYDDIDVLTAHGLIKSRVVGQRPYPLSEIGRMISEAIKNFDKRRDSMTTDASSYVDELLTQLKKEYASHLRDPNGLQNRPFAEIHILKDISTEFTFLNSPTRPYFDQAQQLNANYNPLVQNRAGRHLKEGSQLSWETTHAARVSDHFALFYHPRMQFQVINEESQKEIKSFVQELYSSIYLFNTQIDIGRKAIHWGQGRFGGLMFSNNARPLDGIQLFNPSPWKAGFLGNLKYSFFFANLGEEQDFKYPHITGLKINLQPIPEFEFGVARAMIFGGTNSPDGSFGEFFGEFFAVRSGDINRINITNSISGFELRGTIPPLNRLEIYAEFYFDDVTLSHLFRSLHQDAGILAGLYVPRLDDSGSLNLRIEGRLNSSILYKHGIWSSGWALNNYVMGDPLGADAASFFIELNKTFNHRTVLRNNFTFERIDSDVYRGVGSSGGRQLTNNGQHEKRYRYIVGLDHKFTRFLQGNVTLGYERLNSFNFSYGNDQDNFLFNVGFSLNADTHATFKTNH